MVEAVAAVPTWLTDGVPKLIFRETKYLQNNATQAKAIPCDTSQTLRTAYAKLSIGSS